MRFLHASYSVGAVMGVLLLTGQAGICVNLPAGMTPEEIVRQAAARAQSEKTNDRRIDYAYTKQVVVEDLDNQGRVTETKEKVFRFSSGQASLEQVKINGQIAVGARLKQEEDQLARQRSQLSESKTSKRD